MALMALSFRSPAFGSQVRASKHLPLEFTNTVMHARINLQDRTRIPPAELELELPQVQIYVRFMFLRKTKGCLYIRVVLAPQEAQDSFLSYY